MRRHVGLITGAMTGNSAEVVGTDGTAAQPRRLPRCLSTSGSIQRIGIPGKWSSNRICITRNTVTSRVTPSCGNAIRSRPCQRHRRSGVSPSKDSLSGKNRGRLKGEVPGSRISSGLRHVRRMVPPPRAHSHRNVETETPRDQPRPHHNPGARKSRMAGNRHSQTSVTSRHHDRRVGKKNGRTGTLRANQNADKDRSRSAARIAMSIRS